MTSRVDYKRIWDQRAKADATYFISGDINTDVVGYLDKGRALASFLTADFFRRHGFDPRNKRMLDLGCGIGRFVGGFAEMFGRVIGVDVSGEMIRRARQLHSSLPNVEFLETSGFDLSPLPSGYFDFVFSHWVFPHIHERWLVERYLREIYRVLNGGGLMKLDIGRQGFVAIFGFLPIPRGLVSKAPRRLLAAYERINSFLPRRTRLKRPRYPDLPVEDLLGACFTAVEVRDMIASAGLTLLSIEKAAFRLPSFWVCGRKGQVKLPPAVRPAPTFRLMRSKDW